MVRPTYCTREDVKQALDVKETARANSRIDRHILAASTAVESLCHRVFYPHIATKTFRYPDPNRTRAWRLWLGEHSVISVSGVAVRGGDSLLPYQYLLEPSNSGPPYTSIELDYSLADGGAFGGAIGTQRAVEVTGLFGYKDESVLVGALAEGATNNATSITVTDSSDIGVGSTLILGSERVVVSGRTLSDTGATLSGALSASLAQTAVTVSDAALVAVGEAILLGSERMVVDDIAGNTLLVRRAEDGSVLAAHSGGEAVYAARTLLVDRAALGTEGSAHLQGTDVRLVQYPGLIRDLAIAEALSSTLQDQSGWARVVGSGEMQRELSGKGLGNLRDQVYWAHGRNTRKMAI